MATFVLWFCVARGAFYALGFLLRPLLEDMKPFDPIEWVTRTVAIAVGVCAFLAVR